MSTINPSLASSSNSSVEPIADPTLETDTNSQDAISSEEYYSNNPTTSGDANNNSTNNIIGASCPANFLAVNPADFSAANHPSETLGNWTSRPTEVQLLAGKPSVASTNNVVSPGYPLSINADLGNPKPQSPLGWVTGGLIELSDPENLLARNSAQIDFGLKMNSDNRTLTLPNTKQGGEIYADIQYAQDGLFRGNNLDHNGGKLLPTPRGASPEFSKAYNERSQQLALLNAAQAGTLILGTLTAGGGRGNYKFEPPVTRIERPITQPRIEPLTGTGRGNTPIQPSRTNTGAPANTERPTAVTSQPLAAARSGVIAAFGKGSSVPPRSAPTVTTPPEANPSFWEMKVQAGGKNYVFNSSDIKYYDAGGGRKGIIFNEPLIRPIDGSGRAFGVGSDRTAVTQGTKIVREGFRQVFTELRNQGFDEVKFTNVERIRQPGRDFQGGSRSDRTYDLNR
jgi:hypothetical protein